MIFPLLRNLYLNYQYRKSLRLFHLTWKCGWKLLLQGIITLKNIRSMRKIYLSSRNFGCMYWNCNAVTMAAYCLVHCRPYRWQKTRNKWISWSNQTEQNAVVYFPSPNNSSGCYSVPVTLSELGNLLVTTRYCLPSLIGWETVGDLFQIKTVHIPSRALQERSQFSAKKENGTESQIKLAKH